MPRKRSTMVIFQFLSILTLFSWLGMMHRRKLGLVLRRVAISLVRDSLQSCPTVRNMPFFVLSPAAPKFTGPLFSPDDTWSRPTILSTDKHKTGMLLSKKNMFMACSESTMALYQCYYCKTIQPKRFFFSVRVEVFIRMCSSSETFKSFQTERNSMFISTLQAL